MRKRKLTFQKLSEMGCGFNYFRKVSFRGVNGYIYHMCRPLTQEERDDISCNYQNTHISWGSHRYAPEQRFDVVFLGVKCF